MPFSRRALLVLVVGLLLAVPSSAATRRSVPRGWVGVVAGLDLTVAHPDLIPSEVAAMRSAGIESLRASVYWSDLQPRRRGPILWEQFDPVVEAAAREGIDLLVNPVRAPGWAAADPDDLFPRPADPLAYARFLVRLVERYGPIGTFWAEHPELPYRPVHLWQVWNEPDLTYWWTTPWPTTYVRTLRATHTLVKRADPGSTLVLGGLTGVSWNHLEEVYRAGGKGLFDVVALHPYTKTVDHALEIVRRGRAVMTRYGDGKLPIWLTEISWPSAGRRTSRTYTFVTDEAGQARQAGAILPALAAQRRALGIGRVFWFSWLSRDASKEEPFDYAGLRAIAGRKVRAKPAFFAWSRATLALEGRR